MAEVTQPLVCLLACGLVAWAIAYGEQRAWRGLMAFGLYAVAGLMASELVAAPLMWLLFNLRAGLVESLAMTTALGVGLHQTMGLILDRDAYADFAD